MEPILIGKNICQDFARCIQREWLDANGLGGFASSSIGLINTRRYHGLLVAATKPPEERFVLLSALEDCLQIEQDKYFLSAHLYPGTVYPRGYEYLVQFSMDPFPTFIYEVGDTQIKKTIFMLHKENAVLITYKILRSEVPVKLEVRPLIAFRNYHRLTAENPAMNRRSEAAKGEIKIHPYESLPPLHFIHNAVITDKSGYWYKNFEYARELERGLDYREDLYAPFSLSYSFVTTDEVYLLASTQSQKNFDLSETIGQELERRMRIAAGFPTKDRVWSYLWQTAETFLVDRRGGEKGVIAGYHWFGDWGRDTMISLHGLLLMRGKFEEARDILVSYSHYVNQGIIPNRFPDFGETPEYNTVDASLWYIHAVYEYLEYSDDVSTVETKLYPVLKKIMKYYREGTHFGIKMDKDGLIQAGTGNIALTWMDARVREVPVTPRHGKPVEINALWYNALCILAGLAGRFGENKLKQEYTALAEQAKESFNRLFWCAEQGYLYDVAAQEPDSSLRPNQIFAIGLPFPVLDEKKWKEVLRVVEEELLTPFGLRTLSPKDPKYVPFYEGDAEKRDSSYHQGTVWPWLMGTYVAAYLRAFGKSKEVKMKIRRQLDALLEHIEDIGLGSISEIFDAEYPHTARGCVSQAWSVAELLRAYELLKADEIKLQQPKEFILR